MPAYPGIAAATPPAILKTGLLAEYRFLEGSGQNVYDVSGNDKHATLGSSASVSSDDPTWTATGLIYDGGDTVKTAELAAVYGLDVVFKPPAEWNISTVGFGLLGPDHAGAAIIIGTANGSVANEYITVETKPTGGYATDSRRHATNAAGAISAAWHLLQIDVAAATDYWSIVLDGVEVGNTNFGTNEVRPFLTDQWLIGDSFSNAAVPTNTEFACVIFYGDVGSGLGRSTAQQAANRSALILRMAQRGITLP